MGEAGCPGEDIANSGLGSTSVAVGALSVMQSISIA